AEDGIRDFHVTGVQTCALPICGAMLIAGHETTTNLISNGIWLLLTHPDQRALLEADASLYPSAVEEILRYESPFQMVPRTITTRSEERRVGKECRSRWRPSQNK